MTFYKLFFLLLHVCQNNEVNMKDGVLYTNIWHAYMD